MRVFVALDLPEEVRRAVADFVRTLEPACPGARWARVSGIHITLKFIGEAPPEIVVRIKEALASIALAAPVELCFREVGFFPNARHPRVFWAGIEASPNLAELAAAVEGRLEKLGIPREQRPFKPHLTLARFKSEVGLARLHDGVKRYPSLEFGAMRTGEFHLYQSHLKPGGAEYARLATFAFLGGAR